MKFSFIFIFSLLIFGLTSDKAEAFSFERNLKYQDQGEDVLELQKFLNLDSETKVAESGPGSPGMETSYFGMATLSAVKKFQDKYSKDVLNVAGLSVSTGFVGQFTRNKVNSLVKGGSNYGNLNIAELVTESEKILEKPLILSISPSKIYAGSQVKIFGSGFDEKKNTIRIGDYVFDNLPSIDGTNIVFEIPKNIPVGKHIFSLTNSSGVAENINGETSLIVSREGEIFPQINSLSPNKAGAEDEVVISGRGFEKTGNEIYSIMGVITLSSSDEKTLRFKIKDLPKYNELKEAFSLSGKAEFEFPIYIQNSLGKSAVAKLLFKVK